MANTSITNEKRAVYLLVPPTSGSGDGTYYRLGEGINTITPANNGQISTKHYVNAKFATSRRNGLQKQWAFSGDRVVGDQCNDYLYSLSEETGSDVETYLIIADLSGTSPYTAKKYKVMIDLSNDGSIEGGQDVAIDGTIYANGDPVEGTVVITSATETTAETAVFTATSST